MSKNGLIWQKALLHTHTPFDERSDDYQCSSMKEFLDILYNKGFRIVALTDHYHTRETQEIFSYFLEHKQEYPNLFLIPGMEFTNKDGMHVLLYINPIYDTSKFPTVEQYISRMVGRIDEGEDDHGNHISTLLVQELIEKSRIEKDIIFGLAHITEDSGFNTVEHRNKERKIILESGEIFVECKYDDIESKIGSFCNLDLVPIVNHSDIKQWDMLEDAKRITYLKLPINPSFYDFKQVLTVPSLRIKTTLIPASHPYISSVKIENDLIDCDLDLNSGLNIVIGSKGVGKSFFLENLARVFEIKPKEKHTLSDYDGKIEKYSKIKDVITIEDSTGQVGSVSNGLPSSSDELIKPIFYFQHDLDETGKFFQQQLLTRVDESYKLHPQHKKIIPLLEEQEVLLDKLTKITRKISDNYSQLKNPLELQTELEKDEEVLRTKESQKTSDVFKKHIENISSETKCIEINKELGSYFSHLRSLDLAIPNIEPWQTPEYKPQIDSIIRELSIFPETLKDYIKTHISTIQDLSKEFTESLNHNIDIFNQENLDKIHDLPKEERILITQIDELKKNMKINKKQIEDNDKKLQEIKTDEIDLKDLLMESNQLNEKINNWRQEVINNINSNFHELRSQNPNLFEVNFQIRDSWDTEHIKNVLNEVFKSQSGTKKTGTQVRYSKEELIDEFMEQRSPYDLFEILIGESHPNFSEHFGDGAKGAFVSYKAERTKEIAQYQDWDASLKGVSNLDLLRLKIACYAQKASCQVNKGSWVDLDELSNGERNSLLLYLLCFQASEQPLVIDQPEDELDYVSKKEIVQQFSKLKEARQFILVTHNASIPVCADADLIIYIHKDYSITTGTFSDMRKFLMDMDGGEQAIKNRGKRYYLE